ncbi:hypothetical protein [uncultured Phocaeicola sp.]|uniref:hypothetical protein n=1 Tax=uncultured Phocaeicola sp. TaxID=990718 RepID=UPI0025FB9B3A|nr:hypothetical protein [uncultured Phocaeicola sp.]
MDPDRKYPGFVDILKAIIGCYYIAKMNGYKFKIHFDTPFQLSKFLSPLSESNDWILSACEKADIDKLNISIGLMDYNGIGKIPQLTRARYQVRNFIGWNILQRNNMVGWEKKWHELYHELFQPSNYLLKNIAEFKIKENEYIAIHIRFVNALELAEPDFPQKPLNEVEKMNLISSCISKIKELESTENSKAVVFSDSNYFLSRCRDMDIFVLAGNVGHITYNQNDEIVLKMFIDLNMIARAKKVFSLRSNNLYASAFPLYGSIIGGKLFSVVNL